MKLCNFVQTCIYTPCPTFCYFPHQIPSHTLMRSLTPAQCTCVLELLDKGQSCPAISSITGIGVGSIFNIHSKHHSTISKSVGGCPQKLSPANTQYAIHCIASQKAENATEVTNTLQDMTNTFFLVKTVQRALRGTGMKAVTKQKQPFLSKKHRRLRMDFAEAHKDWTVEDLKRVIWSDETKINCLGSDGKKWVWKKPGERGWLIGWCREQSSLEGVLWWSGAVCSGKGLDMQPKLMGGWMLIFLSAFWMMNFKN